MSAVWWPREKVWTKAECPSVPMIEFDMDDELFGELSDEVNDHDVDPR